MMRPPTPSTPDPTPDPDGPLDFKHLVRSFASDVFRWVRHGGVRAPDQEDAVQEVFMRALDKRDTYDARKSKPQHWLYGFAVNVSREARRTKRRRGEMLTGDMPDVRVNPALNPPEHSCEVGSSAFSTSCSTRCNPSTAPSSMAVTIDEIPVKEVAAAHGIAEATVYAWCAAAEKSLHREICSAHGGVRRGRSVPLRRTLLAAERTCAPLPDNVTERILRGVRRKIDDRASQTRQSPPRLAANRRLRRAGRSGA